MTNAHASANVVGRFPSPSLSLGVVDVFLLPNRIVGWKENEHAQRHVIVDHAE